MTSNMKTLRKCTISAGLATLVGILPLACTRSATQVPSFKSSAPVTVPEMGDISKQTTEEVEAKSAGCVSCHLDMDTKTMHTSSAVAIGCIDCHGGDSTVNIPAGAVKDSPTYNDAMNRAHILPKNTKIFKGSANPPISGAYGNSENWEFIRFINPGDLRVADLACGTAGCHVEEVSRVRKSMMTTGSHLWAAALYNNGGFPAKRANYGEAYSRDGQPLRLQTVPPPTEEETRTKGWLPYLNPLPRWEVAQPGNILRVFERGGRKLPDGIALITQHSLPGGAAVGFEHDDEPGKVILKRLSQRGLGTNLRTDPVYLGLQKTRLLDPTLNHLGTNDKPGDYRSSGCTACHTLYANDREPAHSGPIAKFGNRGESQQKDPTIPKGESGHPIEHVFTRAIPSSQCVVCHLHPGTSVTQAYYGYIWWDNEYNAELMYPEEERDIPITSAEFAARLDFNPEEGSIRGLWSDPEFLWDMTDLNNAMKTMLNPTKFADFHGHGWIFRAIYKQDKKGNLLTKEGTIISADDPDKLAKAVHMKDIHLEKGMHCIDCHFLNDNHGNGKLYGAMRNAVEIDCRDCHGTASKRPTLKTSGPAAPEGGTDLTGKTTPFGKKRFQWRGKKLLQRSNVQEDLEWEIVQTTDTVTPGHKHYNEKSAVAKTIQRDGKTWGDPFVGADKLAHADSNQNCYSCHTSWMTSCYGCHLPMRANFRRPMLHNEQKMTRNWTSYCFQTLREDVFMLGRDDTVMGKRVTTMRSACAVYVSSQNANREWIYASQQTVSTEGFSGHAFAPSYAHAVRGKGETRMCSDCHLSEKDDNNANMAMVLMQGTNAYNYHGRYVYVAERGAGTEAMVVAEIDEPQANIGSTLQSHAYPARYAKHKEGGNRLTIAYDHSSGSSFNPFSSSDVQCVQHRGEYLYAACGPGGVILYDVANIANKGFGQRITTQEFSPLGMSLSVATKDAKWIASPTTLGVDPTRQRYEENEEGPIHLLYAFLYVADAEEGLIMILAGTLLDGDPNNNTIDRTITFNPGGKLTGARFVEIVGNYAYVLTDKALVVVDLSNALEPKIASELPMDNATRLAVQFRYGFVATGSGLKVIDCTDLANPKLTKAEVPMETGAHSVYVVRTYAYVAAKSKGFAIIDVENPEKPKLVEYFTGGKLRDTHDVKVSITVQSYFAYVADGENGFHVVQLTSPDYTPGIGGFAVKPTPKWIAYRETNGPCVMVEEGIDRDRGVDESGNQLSVYGRIGSLPLTKEEATRMYMRNGQVWKVNDDKPPSALDKKFKDENFFRAGRGEKLKKPKSTSKKKKKKKRRRGGSSKKADDKDAKAEEPEKKPSRRRRRRKK